MTWRACARVAGLLGVVAAPLHAQLRPDPDWRPADPPGPAAYTLDSEVLGEERRVVVHLPPSHEETARPYPLILVLDGEAILPTVAAAYGALTAAGHAPEAVIVGVENTHRLRDLSPPGVPVSGNDGAGRADRFLRFLDRELVPGLAARFRADDPVTVVGHSSGGLFAHYALATRPERYARVLALDAPMHLERSAAPLLALARARPAAIRLVSVEARFGWPDGAWGELVGAAPPGWTLSRRRTTGETHASMLWPGSYDGLKALFSDYATLDDATTPAARLSAFDARHGLRASLPPPRVLLREVVEDRLDTRDGLGAAEVLERLVEAYGSDGQTRTLESRIAALDGADPEGPGVEELLATQRASAAEAEVLLGDWVGYTQQVGASTRAPLGLRVGVEDGRAVGRFTFGQGPEHAIEYLTVSGTTVHVGYMNRMRPRGMLMYEGEVVDGVFEGAFVLRGVSFELPGGRALPEVRFRLERTGR